MKGSSPKVDRISFNLDDMDGYGAKPATYICVECWRVKVKGALAPYPGPPE